MSSILNATTTSGLVTSADNSGSLQLQTNNGTTAVTIDTSQNVGIGTTSPVRRFHVSGGDAQIDYAYNSSGTSFRILNDATPSNGVNLVTEYYGSGSYGPLKFTTGNSERMRITSAGLLQFDSGYGSVATAYGCRAWVNFNGTGTVAIRASGNVTSITDLGTGDYRVNFTNNMPDANYVANVTSGVNGVVWGLQQLGPIYSTSQLQFKLFDTSGIATDNSIVNVSIIR